MTMATGPEEMLVLPLSGSCEIDADGQEFALQGRGDVSSAGSRTSPTCPGTRPSPSQRAGRPVRAAGRCRVARLAVRYGAAADVPVELRGARAGEPPGEQLLRARGLRLTDQLVAVEVLTPAGNWSSYPPHKHDKPGPGEAVLEEIYYFELGRGQSGGHGARLSAGLLHRRRTVRSTCLPRCAAGDIVLVPHGYHGPSMAAPGHHMYYLNVLAGPAQQRSMAFCDDPAHAWMRDSWHSQAVDPRLPMTSAEEATCG